MESKEAVWGGTQEFQIQSTQHPSENAVQGQKQQGKASGLRSAMSPSSLCPRQSVRGQPRQQAACRDSSWDRAGQLPLLTLPVVLELS